jgi:hypothetical protein
MTLVVPSTVEILWPILDGKVWLLDCENGCNHLELECDMHRLYFELFPISL